MARSSRRGLLGLLLTGAAAGLTGAGGRAAADPAGLIVRLVQDMGREEGRPEPPRLRAATAEERKAAIASIEAQLRAFRDDDYLKAQKYQSAGLRRQIRSPEEFRAMMRDSYPQFASYKSATFDEGRASEKGDVVQIRITLTGQDGITVRARYTMVREEGEYRVAGVEGGTPPRGDTRNIA